MSYPGTLTPAEQASLLAWLRTSLRPVMGELARLNNHLQAANTEYNGVQLALLAKLAAGDIVPVESGLDGAEQLINQNGKKLDLLINSADQTNRLISVVITLLESSASRHSGTLRDTDGT